MAALSAGSPLREWQTGRGVVLAGLDVQSVEELRLAMLEGRGGTSRGSTSPNPFNSSGRVPLQRSENASFATPLGEDQPGAAKLCSVEVDGETISLQLETSEAGLMRENEALKNAEAVGLVYSITDRESFKALSALREEIAKIKADDDYLMILIGRDSHDEFERKVPREKADALAKKWKCSFFEVSLLTYHNIEEVLQSLAKYMASNLSKSSKRKRSLPFRLFAKPQQPTVLADDSSMTRSRNSTTVPYRDLEVAVSTSASIVALASSTLIEVADQAVQNGDKAAAIRGRAGNFSDTTTASGARTLQMSTSGQSDTASSPDSDHMRVPESPKDKRGSSSKKGSKKTKERNSKTLREMSNKRRWRTSRKKEEKEKDLKLPVGRRPIDMRMLGQRQTMMKLSERMQSLSTINIRPAGQLSHSSLPLQEDVGEDTTSITSTLSPNDMYSQSVTSSAPDDITDAPPHMQMLDQPSVIRTSYSRIYASSSPQEYMRMERALDELLHNSDLLRYKANILQAQDLRLVDLPLLKEWDLDRLGITIMGHKKKLLKALQQTNRILNGEAEPCYWVMDPSELSLGKRLGGGNFGDVPIILRVDSLGKWRGTTTVAIKQLRDVDASSLQEEAKIMSSVAVHPNVVSLYGVAISPGSAYLVTEFIPDGPLDSYLKSNINRIPSRILLRMCRDVAAGMDHLHSHRIVHRDLAARNLLLKLRHTCEPIVKVCDFGLSRMLEASEYYWATKSLMPIRWSSPEALRYRKFTSKSDVWSFGIVMWEILSFGQVPYNTLDNGEVMDWLERGERLPQPHRCPDAAYRLMLKCWHSDPKKRPAFAEIYSVLEDMVTDMTTLTSTSSDASDQLFSSGLTSPSSSPASSPRFSNAYLANTLSTSSISSCTEENESEGKSGSIDLISDNNRLREPNLHQAKLPVSVGSSDLLAYGTNWIGSHESTSHRNQGNSERSEGTLQGSTSSLETKRESSMKVKPKKSKKDKRVKKEKKKTKQKQTETMSQQSDEMESKYVSSIGSNTHGLTSEQGKLETTTRRFEKTDVLAPEMELKFKESIEWTDKKPCHFMIRVGAHVWCASQFIHIFHAMTTQHIYTIKSNFRSRVYRLAYINGLVWSSDENTIRLWDPDTVRTLKFAPIAELNEHTGMVRSILPVYATDELPLGGSGVVTRDLPTTSIASPMRASSPPYPPANKQGRTIPQPSELLYVWTCDTNGKIIVWDHKQRPPVVLSEISLREEPVSCMCQVGSAVWLGAEKRIYCVDLHTHAMFHWTAHQRTVNDLYHENGVVWSSANDGKIKIWNGGDTPRTVNLVSEISVMASVNCFEQIVHPKYPSAKWLCTGAAFGAVTVWDPKIRVKKQEVKQKDVIKCLLWVEETLTLWSASFDRAMQLWHLCKVGPRISTPTQQ